MVFPTLAAADGSTLVCQPGDTVELNTDPQVAGLEPAAAKPAPAADPAPAPETPVNAPTADPAA